MTHSKYWKEKNIYIVNQEIFHPEELSFKHEGEIQTFSDKYFVVSWPSLQAILKTVFQDEKKWPDGDLTTQEEMKNTRIDIYKHPRNTESYKHLYKYFLVCSLTSLKYKNE